MDVSRVALIGTSDWAQMMHLTSLKSDPRCLVTAICGRNRERTRQVAVRYHIPKTYSDYSVLLEKEETDAVVICVPNYLHYPIAIEALRRGKHVLCEKPLALTGAEAMEMLNLATQARVAHMVCFTYRWMPTFRYLKTLIDEGYVGEIFHAGLSYISGYGRQREYAWRFDAAQAGCGVVSDLGSHVVDLARWFGGEIESVSSRFTKTLERGDGKGEVRCDAEDSAILTLRYASGASGVIHVSAVAWLGDDDRELIRIEVLGTEGSLWADFGWETEQTIRSVRIGEKMLHKLTIPHELWCGTDEDNAEATLQHLITNTSHGPRALIDAIYKGEPASPSFYDGWRAQEVIDAACAAQRTGAWSAVRPPLKGEFI